MTNQQRFLQTIIQSMGASPELLDWPGVTVHGAPHRAENKVSAGYQLGSHFFITCDPAVEEVLSEATASMAPTFEAFRSLAAEHQAELLGGGFMYVLPTGEISPTEVPTGFTLRSLSRDSADDVALIEQLVSISSEDDLDEAEVDADDLDPFIEVALDSAGLIAAYSAARSFDMAATFYDIGILTRPDCRGKHLGKATVTALCNRLLAAGHDPLYRHETANTASRALAASLGFEPATELVAYRFAG